MKIPLLDLCKQYESIKDEIEPALLEICRTQTFVLGPRVAQFEKEIADYCHSRYALGVSSGTDAMLIALMALEIGPGDEVITTPFTFFATAGCVARVGAKPVFVDVDPATFNIDPAAIEAKITPQTKAILPVHLYGQCADMKAIMEIARRRKIAVIEDACQAIGADCVSGRAGSIGEFGCYSFYPSKNLSAFGDAGLLTTNDEQMYRKAKLIRTHGEEPRYYHHLIGGNFRLDAIQAAVLSLKLPHLEKWQKARIRNAQIYGEMFKKSGIAGTNMIVPAATQTRHVFNQYTIRADKRDELMAFLQSNEIGCGIYYPVPLHLQECFAYLGGKAGDLPHAEEVARTVLSLPVYPELTEEQIRTVARTVIAFYQK